MGDLWCAECCAPADDGSSESGLQLCAGCHEAWGDGTPGPYDGVYYLDELVEGDPPVPFDAPWEVDDGQRFGPDGWVTLMRSLKGNL